MYVIPRFPNPIRIPELTEAEKELVQAAELELPLLESSGRHMIDEVFRPQMLLGEMNKTETKITFEKYTSASELLERISDDLHELGERFEIPKRISDDLHELGERIESLEERASTAF